MAPFFSLMCSEVEEAEEVEACSHCMSRIRHGVPTAHSNTPGQVLHTS